MDNKEQLKADNLFVYATKSEEISKEVQDLVSQSHSTTKIVRLESRLLDDLVKAESKPETKSLDEFLNNQENKDEAEKKALTLWNILTHNGDYNDSVKRIFTKSEVVKRTNLSNKKLGEALDLFHLFGLVEFTKDKYEFRFCFGKEIRKAGVYADIINDIALLNADISRYRAMFKEDNLERDAAMIELESNIKELIKF